jgi:hypothetical protein
VALVFCLPAFAQAPGEISGRVLDAVTKEPIRKALVSVRALSIETVTDDDGHFVLSKLPPDSEVEIYVSTVGYGLLKRPVRVGLVLEILLGQEAAKPFEITVATKPFAGTETNTPSEHTLNNTELKNLANVLIDDPLRSVQSLPGVTANDDFYAQFSLRGSGFHNIGLYIDGVLTEQAFHTVQDENDSGSLTILNGDVVESVSLLSAAAPAEYGDRTGGVLKMKTRDGSTERLFGRANVAATGMSFTGEGPIGPAKKLSWLASARKSYADWLIEKLADDPATAVALGYTDAHLKLTYDPVANRHRINLTALGGNSRADRERERESLGVNSLLTADMRTRIVNTEWIWAGLRAVSLTNVYYSRGTGENHNVGGELLFRATVTETALRNDTTFYPGHNHTIQTGLFVRHHEENDIRRRFATSTGFVPTDEFGAKAWQPGFYLEDTWNPRTGVTLTVGGRFDAFSPTGERVALPRASLSISPYSKLTISAGWGQYAQFPNLVSLYGEFGDTNLVAPRSTHYVMSVEHLITEKTRVRVEVYDEEERSVLFSEQTEPRLVDGKVTLPQKGPLLRNTLRGYSRGVEIYVQRRSANRLSGWISYALGYTRFRDEFAGLGFDGDYDQRHTASVYGSYRLSRSLNLSLKFRYGSNFPAVGFLTYSGASLFLAPDRNRVRLPQYSRLDLRANRAFHFDRWKLTLYTEVTNALKRKNVRFSDLDRVASNGRVQYFRENLLPLLPSAGIAVEF